MGAVPAIIGAVVAAGSATYGAVSSSNARKDAQGAANKQQDEETSLAAQQAGAKQIADSQEQAKLANANSNLTTQNASGFSSTIGTTPMGLVNPGMTGGQKTLLGS